jgi:hypothetical protein
MAQDMQFYRVVGKPSQASAELALSRLATSEGDERSVPPEAAREMQEVLSTASLAGTWRAELETGLLYWSAELYKIYGFPPIDGPANFAAAMQCYDPADRLAILDAIDFAAREKCGFRLRLPLRPRNGAEQIFTHTIACFRQARSGGGELHGICAVTDWDRHVIEPLI